MKTLKLSALLVFLFFSLFTISSVKAKIAPVDLGVAPVDVSIPTAQYGNTIVAPVTTTAPSFTTNNNISSNLVASPACGWHNGQYYPLPCTSYPIDKGLIFLLIAGLAVGVKVLLNRTQMTQTVDLKS
jgi:hypothetical protein